MYGLNTSRQVWTALSTRYASPSRSRVNHLRRQLQTTRQDSRTCSDFIHYSKSISDQLALVGKPVSDEELISYIVGGLNPQYNPFVTSYSFATKDTAMTFEEFQSELLSYEQLLAAQAPTTESNVFALYSHKRPGQNRKPKYGSSPKPNFGKNLAHKRSFPSASNAPQGKPSSTQFSTNKPPCQICGRTNHQALDCFHRMDYAYQGRHPPKELAAMVAQSNLLHEDETWLADSGATNHITADLENLTLQQPYQGTETVAVGNGNGLNIAHTGSTTYHLPNSDLHLNDILHCPNVSTNLLSIQKFCQDNNCYFKLTDSYFLVKDNLTGAILLQGPSEGSLYPVHLNKFVTNKRASIALNVIKASTDLWHKRLGHPNSQILHRVLKDYQLLLSSN